jgi:hypothetical protein
MIADFDKIKNSELLIINRTAITAIKYAVDEKG